MLRSLLASIDPGGQWAGLDLDDVHLDSFCGPLRSSKRFCGSLWRLGERFTVHWPMLEESPHDVRFLVSGPMGLLA